jgi:hypothetical protein
MIVESLCIYAIAIITIGATHTTSATWTGPGCPLDHACPGIATDEPSIGQRLSRVVRRKRYDVEILTWIFLDPRELRTRGVSKSPSVAQDAVSTRERIHPAPSTLDLQFHGSAARSLAMLSALCCYGDQHLTQARLLGCKSKDVADSCILCQ